MSARSHQSRLARSIKALTLMEISAKNRSADEQFAVALSHHQAGRLAEAERLYRQICAQHPRHVETLHYLGVLAGQTGRMDVATDLIGRALALKPDYAEARYNLANLLAMGNRLDQAIPHYEQVIALKPDFVEAHFSLGNLYALSKRLDQAAARFRHVLLLKPDFAEAHNCLGTVLADQGNPLDAIACFQRALALKPNFAEAHYNHALALEKEDRLDDAAREYERAVALKPDFHDAYYNLGNVRKKQNRLDDAAKQYERALALKPELHAACYNLGNVRKEQERLDDAAIQYRRALALKPDYAEAYDGLGTALLLQGRADEALACFEGALALKPDFTVALSNRGMALRSLNRPAEALASYERALALDPDFVDALVNRGIMLRDLNRPLDALASYEKALAINPRSAVAYFNLADSTEFVQGDRHLAAMQALVHENLSSADSSMLYFALGKAYADLNDHARAFEHWLQGNALKRSRIVYDEARTIAEFERIKAVFTPALIKEKEGHGDPSAVPIFVLGMPRSGSTLVEQILASHPLVHGAGELRAFGEALSALNGPDGNLLPYPEFIPAADDALLRQIGARYVSELRKHSPTAAHVTDKMPTNFYFAGMIHLALPNARIIHTVRDPVDTCISCFSKLFGHGHDYNYDLAELGRYYRRYLALMAHWQRVLPQGRILDVRYEDVVADLEGQARRILAHCGLPWDPQCLSFYQSPRPVMTASASQVRQPIYSSAIGRRHRYERFIAPLLSELNAPS
ncbi:MAG TPA: tetratricopeptide repeat protein [Xanthobacteraceae bacterium]|nr:tetratricopeptide repeat protein [Xanthobacteraceae bacterium]